MTATFYLGSHHATTRWWALGVPLFVSVRVMRKRKTLPSPIAPWALDSGAFTEVSRGGFETTPEDYIADVLRLAAGMDHLQWVAPQDWMCEPFIIAKTGLSVTEHQRRTVENFLTLRESLGALVIPVIQGFGPRDYDRCIAMYHDAGVALDQERTVGLGSVCRRSGTDEIRRLILYLADYNLALHGFGIKGSSFVACSHVLASADSMAWSAAARHGGRDANSPVEAMRWRSRLLASTTAADAASEEAPVSSPRIGALKSDVA